MQAAHLTPSPFLYHLFTFNIGMSVNWTSNSCLLWLDKVICNKVNVQHQTAFCPIKLTLLHMHHTYLIKTEVQWDVSLKWWKHEMLLERTFQQQYVSRHFCQWHSFFIFLFFCTLAHLFCIPSFSWQPHSSIKIRHKATLEISDMEWNEVGL